MSEEKKIGISNSDRAHVLVQAMPYIKRFESEFDFNKKRFRDIQS